MPSELITVNLFRESRQESWGFSVTGGLDVDEALCISHIEDGSIAQIVGLKLDDVLIKINGREAGQLEYREAVEEMEVGEDELDVVLERSCARKISYEKSATNFSLFLGSGGSSEVTMGSEAFISNRPEMERTTTVEIRLEKSPMPEEAVEEKEESLVNNQEKEVSPAREEKEENLSQPEPQKEIKLPQFMPESKPVKVVKKDSVRPSQRRDWNCPWVKKDGRGLKKIYRGIWAGEPVSAPTATSHDHFYSEPQSILDPPIPESELREIQERFLEEQRLLVERENEKRRWEQQQRKHILEQRRREEQERVKKQQQQQQQQQQRQREKQQQQREKQQQQEREKQQQEKRVRFREQVEESNDDHMLEEDNANNVNFEDEEPPSLELVSSQRTDREAAENQKEGKSVDVFSLEDSEILSQLAQALQSGMASYKPSEGYEPSADELIDVLKSLENLAASNPPLYRAIVDQIKLNQPQSQNEQDEVLLEEEEGEETAQHFDSMDDPLEDLPREIESVVTEEMDVSEDKEEEKQQFTEATAPNRPDHNEERRQFIEEEQPLPHVEPFPEVLTKPSKAENQEQHPREQPNSELEDEEMNNANGMSQTNHEEPMTNGTEEGIENGGTGFYPKPMADYDYPWAGSLRPVSNELFRKDYQKRKVMNDPGPCPWAGSLRHIGDAKKNRMSHRRKNEDTENAGGAPWMGSLRHVSGPNHVSKAFKEKALWQSKRYPDEDAPNPYKGSQGRDARHAHPLTAAAFVNSANREEALRKEEEEEIERIRANLRERRTVSSALLKVLMPKLLKEHESKYEPLEEDESLHIMEEILAMKIGLSPDQAVDDNDEADRMIRAITHDEIDNSVYSQMADDLERAAQKKKKGGVLKKVGVAAKKGGVAAKKAVKKTSKEELPTTATPTVEPATPPSSLQNEEEEEGNRVVTASV